MNSPKSFPRDLKSAALILALIGLILVSGFISSKTILTETSLETPHWPNVNATSIEPPANVNSGESGVRANDSELGAATREIASGSGNPDVSVWVNTKSGVYHCPNTRWYGNTKNGEYMTQKEAQVQGYRPAHGAVCG